MRKRVIAGNWKMNCTIEESKSLIKGILRNTEGSNLNSEVIVAPPFTSLFAVKSLIENSQIKLCAQDVYFESSGAFTGEISPEMLEDAGCMYCIVGHSERRTLLNESDDLIAKKMSALNNKGIVPILCVGENLYIREMNNANEHIRNQLRTALSAFILSDPRDLIIAYEPIWAIGSGKAASPVDADQMAIEIRDELLDLFGDISIDIRILYGGSVNSSNIESFLGMTNIDGALIGGVSLKADEFSKILVTV